MGFGLLGAAGGGLGGIGQVLGLGFSIASQLGQASAQRQAAQAQIARQQQFAIQRNQALALQQESLRTQQTQTEEKGARERFVEQQRLRKAQATAQASASAGGVSGLSVDELLRDFATQTAFFTASSERQEDFAAQQTDLRLRAAKQQSQFDVFTNNPPVESPSFASAALRIGGTVLGKFLR